MFATTVAHIPSADVYEQQPAIIWSEDSCTSLGETEWKQSGFSKDVLVTELTPASLPALPWLTDSSFFFFFLFFFSFFSLSLSQKESPDFFPAISDVMIFVLSRNYTPTIPALTYPLQQVLFLNVVIKEGLQAPNTFPTEHFAMLAQHHRCLSVAQRSPETSP